MSKKTMKKFHVNFSVDGDAWVWGDDKETVEEVMSSLSLSDALDSCDADLIISVYEMPKLKADLIGDGVVTEEEGWICLSDFKDENGERIEPTDQDVPSDYVSMEELEALGQLRLGLEVSNPT